MTKSISIIIFLLFAAISLYSQNTKTLNFSDVVYEKPVSGVMVFVDGDFVSVSDNNGNCQIDNNVNEIYCKYLGYKDTLINIEACVQCEIKLKTNCNLLDEVEVDAKYNEKKHLLRLLKESQQTAYKIDTAIYYKFKEINTIPELEQTEIFTGILRVDNKGYSIPFVYTYVSEISNYYNTIDQNTYELIKTSQIETMLNSNVLFPRMIKRIKKKHNIERPDLSTNDSISFLVLLEKNKVDIEFSYINFVNNRIKTRAYAGTNHKGDGDRKYYLKMDYVLLPISIQEHLVSILEYVLENNLVVHNYVELEKIDNPDIESELNISLNYLSCKELVENVKIKFPDIVIPSELIKK
jgi:hypothetical protein